ncbi:MAG: hypothetical protein K0S47_189 [Herbinix sp.]|nr:hypothetical protein [Herbinix sp.]
MVKINGITNIDKDTVINKSQLRSSNTSNGEFSSYLGETKSLDEIFDKAAKEYNVPVNLLKAIGKAESDFKANAVSRCGAQGIMQLMPATAKSLGVTNSFDPEQNIMGGAKYISDLLKKYDGNTSLALAAYNAGSGNVAKYGGIPPFEETQNYVKKVTKFMGQDIDTGVKTSITSVSPRVIPLPTNNGVTNSLLPNTKTAEEITNYEGVELSEDNDQSISNLFTYEDYLLFLQSLLDEEKVNDKENNDSIFVAAKNINYSAPVLNLLKSGI